MLDPLYQFASHPFSQPHVTKYSQIRKRFNKELMYQNENMFWSMYKCLIFNQKTYKSICFVA